MSSFLEKLNTAILQNIPFVLFSKPNEDFVYLYVQDNSESQRFLFHSFDSEVKRSIADKNPFRLPISEFEFEMQLKLKKTQKTNSVQQEAYRDLIQKTLDFIQNSTISKIVMSRLKVIENEGFDLFKTFRNLMYQHPSALVFLWHFPEKETWIGATPELLLSQIGNRVETVSLAATKLPESQWSPKEYEEQQIVTDFILDCFSEIQKLKVIGPKTVQAGKFQHLKTYISGEIPSDFRISTLLEKLHPTPALCGMPKKEAFDFIVRNEFHSREFYGGYIGLEKQDSKEYYVNLRSAQVFENEIWMYVGGGITAESQPEKEWLETELKSGTIGNALEKSSSIKVVPPETQ